MRSMWVCVLRQFASLWAWWPWELCLLKFFIIIIIIMIIMLCIAVREFERCWAHDVAHHQPCDRSHRAVQRIPRPRLHQVRCCCCCCSVPQLNTEHPVWAPTPVHVQVQVQSIGWGDCVRPFSVTPPCKQPHSVFGVFYLRFRRMRFVMSGVYHGWR